MIKLNMNEYVYFKPKQLAKELYTEHFQRWGVPEKYIKDLPVNENGFAKLQFHEFVDIYGEAINTCIMDKQPIEDFTIYFKENVT